MKKLLIIFNKFFTPFFNTRAAGVYMLLFAIAIAVATFVENDFGTSAAQKIIFKSWWFELLLILFGISIVVNIIKFRMIPQKKWPLLLFHSAIIIILIGAGITRYFGYEGIMHIRENDTSNTFLSSNTFLNFKVLKDNKEYQFNEPVLFASLGNNNWHRSYKIENDLIDIAVKEFIPNAKQIVKKTSTGKPVLKIVIAGMNGREDYFIAQGQTKRIQNMVFNFTKNQLPDAINIDYKNDSLFFNADRMFTQMTMATRKNDTIFPSEAYSPLKLRSLYSDGSNRFVFGDFVKSGEVSIASENRKMQTQSLAALVLEVSVNGNTKETYVYGQERVYGRPALLEYNDMNLSISYGAKNITLPFSIKLKKFIMDKYPGTNNASSYASEVQLIDTQKNISKDFRIYMNNILNYGGYRFFQSSFDRDEKGTYLSVNHDFWGTTISYLGYALLTLGMLWTFFSKKTRFYQVTQKLKKMRAKDAVLLMLLLFSSGMATTQSQSNHTHQKYTVSKEHAEKFSRLIVQDFRGRMKPMHTLSREIMRKVYRRESYKGQNADQVVLGMFANTGQWYGENIIKLGEHPDVKKKLGVDKKYVSYRDFFFENGDYKLSDDVRKALNKIPKDRGVYEKELLKIDERVNIIDMVFSGTMLRIVPDANNPDATWLSAHSHNTGQDENTEANDFFNKYKAALQTGMQTGNYTQADNFLKALKNKQAKVGGNRLPAPAKIKAEIFLNNANIFNRLSLWYFILGMAFLFFLFLSVFKPSLRLKKVYNVLFTFLMIGFMMHTIGLGLRWYVSGRAPWSNGYESMIYIAWTATLAGVLLAKKSFGGLAATMILASTLLFVSMLSFLDPEITPLVPVLKSYWLTIHVSLEAGSYGFLILGAIIGIINLILMILINDTNKKRVKRIITEMTYISELTLLGGLVMVSIGTYLGGVWANESWGRYWGWDAKETWALVTILVYAFILHMRIIPKLFGLFSYNVATIFGLATVVMTYFGVNYYLSGLHSYATGDPIPIPNWVYVFVATILLISVLAYWRKRKVNLM
jgi:cytochrome c-type biogenesis protein CcsB